MEMPELPPLIIMDIFSRLPITTILQCKCVCKTWFNIISDPYFTKLHHARAPVSLILRASGNFFSRWYVLALEGWDKHDSFVPLKQLPREIGHLGEALQFETWCNGLLCISAYCPKNSVTNYVVIVITGEYMSLPKPEPKSDGFKRAIRGFGFSQATNRYKVIQEIYEDRRPLTTHQHHHTSQLEVYTLGTENWRKYWRSPISICQTRLSKKFLCIPEWCSTGWFSLITTPHLYVILTLRMSNLNHSRDPQFKTFHKPRK